MPEPATATSPVPPAAPPPAWDLASYFPAFDGPEYRAFWTALERDLAAHTAAAAAQPPLDGATGTLWVATVLAAEDLAARLGHLHSYIGCLNAGDTASEPYQQAEAALSALDARFANLRTELLRALRSVDDAPWRALLADPRLAGAGHQLERLRLEAQHRMSPPEERLAADLGVDGIKAWGRLYDTVSGKMEFPMQWPDGRCETLPMAQRRALLSHPDRAVRAAAFAGGNRVWQGAEDTMAAALNALAGTRLTLYARRGQADFLEAPLHDHALTRATLEAMFAAIAAHYELPRRVLRLGARLQGTAGLAWYDLDAPRPLAPAPQLTWEEGAALVQQAFDTAYPALGDYLRQALAARWVEAEKRARKAAGAFCTSSPVTREQRIFMTFAGTMQDVITLAHEAGHAWHSHLLGAARPAARAYPMTLAETASTFAEKILVHGLLTRAGGDFSRRAFLLDQETNRAPTYLLNIPVRFLFESRFFAERRRGYVPPSRLRALMTEAQREVYGDTLEAGGEDPWFWASKQHFFLADVSFYNFPYTFGFLLSQALFTEFRREGAAFLPRYEQFLRLTGSATCETAARDAFGWDLTNRQFWAAALGALEEPIREFETLAAAHRPE
jgi:oligoendopeptidase F